MDPQDTRIPKNAIVHVATNEFPGKDHSSYHTFVRNGHFVVIQAPLMNQPLINLRWPIPWAPDEEYAAFDLPREKLLAEIQQVIHTLDFESTTWAVLVKQPDGQHRLISKSHQVDRLFRLGVEKVVDESEIRITAFRAPSQEHTGRWNGREVGVHIAFDPPAQRLINTELKARYMLSRAGLDLCSPLLAHISRDGEIVGFMTEPVQGRSIEYRDKAKVYNAISELEKRNIIIRGGALEQNILIHEGKVRLRGLYCAFMPTDEERQAMEKTVEIYHWNQLNAAFQALSRPAAEPPLPPLHINTLAHFPAIVQKVVPEITSLWRGCFGERLIGLFSWYLGNKSALEKDRKKALRQHRPWLDEVKYMLIEPYLDPESRLPKLSPDTYIFTPPDIHFRPYRSAHRPILYSEREGRVYRPTSALDDRASPYIPPTC